MSLDDRVLRKLTDPFYGVGGDGYHCGVRHGRSLRSGHQAEDTIESVSYVGGQQGSLWVYRPIHWGWRGDHQTTCYGRSRRSGHQTKTDLSRSPVSESNRVHCRTTVLPK